MLAAARFRRAPLFTALDVETDGHCTRPAPIPLWQVSAAQGISTIGLTPLITNYNILLETRTKGIAAAVTRSVREKDGGLRWVGI